MNDQVPGPTNSGYSGGLAAARVAFKCLTQPQAPVNEGCFRPLEIILPEGKILNARPPAALGLWSIPLPTVIDTILKALAPALPDAHSGGAQGRHGRLLDRRLPRRRPALSADEYFRRRLGRPAARGRRIRRGVDLPGRRAQRADRAAGDSVSVPDRALRAAHRSPAAPAAIAAASASK